MSWQSVYILIAVAMALTALAAAAAPISDIDAYWHVALGEELLRTRTVSGLGDGWAWYDPEKPWTTSQWLSETLMALSVRAFGWAGLVYAALVAVGAIVTIGYGVLRTRVSLPLLLIPFGILVLLVLLATQPRPALASILGLLLVAHVAERTLTRGDIPPWWSALLIAVWANMHGLWVVAPVSLGLAMGLRWLSSHSPHTFPYRRSLATVALWVMAGLITPLGVEGVLLPLALASATAHLQEWQPSTPWSLAFLPLGLVLAMFAWRMRRSSLLKRPEVLAWIAFWTLFSLPVLRNVIVSTVMLIPLLATVLVPSEQQAMRVPRPPSALLQSLTLSIAGLAGIAFVVRLLTLQPLAEATPLRIASSLAAGQGPVVVLNDYNTAGVLVAFGPEEVQLGIDGRAERYGAEYIEAYLRLHAVKGDEWPALLEDIDPDVAVVREDSAIRYVLEEVREWGRDLVDGEYVLLRRPLE